MGEYAKRLSDGERIKIGTCESMYYLRYEDRAKVRGIPGSVNVNDPHDLHGLRFRLPFPDEDHLQPGEYDDYARGLRLYRGKPLVEDFTDPETVEYTGNMQLRHEASGLLLNVPCYHGHKLPDVGEARAFWNGKGHSLELGWLKATPAGVMPVVKCRHCENAWRYNWHDIIDFIPEPMRSRLIGYAQEAQQVAA